MGGWVSLPRLPSRVGVLRFYLDIDDVSRMDHFLLCVIVVVIVVIDLLLTLSTLLFTYKVQTQFGLRSLP